MTENTCWMECVRCGTDMLRPLTPDENTACGRCVMGADEWDRITTAVAEARQQILDAADYD